MVKIQIWKNVVKTFVQYQGPFFMFMGCWWILQKSVKSISFHGRKTKKGTAFFHFLWPFVQIGLNFHKFWKSWKNTNIWKNQKVSCLSNFLLDLSLRILSDGRKVQSWSKFNSMLCLSFVPSISKILLSLSTLCYYALVLCYKSKDKITNC